LDADDGLDATVPPWYKGISDFVQVRGRGLRRRETVFDRPLKGSSSWRIWEREKKKVGKVAYMSAAVVSLYFFDNCENLLIITHWQAFSLGRIPAHNKF
jgi:hypothetical protein